MLAQVLLALLLTFGKVFIFFGDHGTWITMGESGNPVPAFPDSLATQKGGGEAPGLAAAQG